MLVNVIKRTYMKWLFLVSGLTFHSLITLLFIHVSRNSTGVLGFFGWFIVYWMFILSFSIVALVLRLFGVLRRQGLLYIYLGLGSFLTGLTGVFIGVGDIKRDILWICLYFATIVLGSTMLSESFIVNLFDRNE